MSLGTFEYNFQLMNFQTINSYDSLVIIESLDINDTKTGLQLGYKLKNQCKEKSIVASYAEVNSKEQFLGTLDEIKNDIINGTKNILSGGAKYPLLHFEIHGSDDGSGLVLSNKEFVSWDDFSSKCREINKATNNNLVIVLAVCHGYKVIVDNVHLNDLTPYYALIGPEKKVYEPDIIDLFPKFYESLFNTNDLTNSLNILKPDYHLYHCEMVYANSYSRYIIEKCKGEGRKKRLDDLVEKHKKRNSSNINEDEVRKKLDDLIKPRKSSYEKMKSKFLFSQRSGNQNRFSVDLDDILKILSQN